MEKERTKSTPLIRLVTAALLTFTLFTGCDVKGTLVTSEKDKAYTAEPGNDSVKIADSVDWMAGDFFTLNVNRSDVIVFSANSDHKFDDNNLPYAANVHGYDLLTGTADPEPLSSPGGPAKAIIINETGTYTLTMRATPLYDYWELK